MTGWRVLGGRTLGNEVRFWFWVTVGLVVARRARRWRREWVHGFVLDPRPSRQEARAWRRFMRSTDRLARVRARIEVYR